jgi:hypothetical protein
LDNVFLGELDNVFLGGFVPLFRGDIAMSLLVFLVQFVTCGIGTIIWAFVYNRSYTTKLIEQGYQLADDERTMTIARRKLGIAVPTSAS